MVHGWEGTYDTESIFVPFHDIWCQVRDLRAEWPEGALEVFKTKAHTTVASVRHSVVLQWRKLGNDAADVRAKEGARLHPDSPPVRVRFDRSCVLVDTLGRYFARVLDWAAARDLLPPSLAALGRPRQLKLPGHVVAIGPGGVQRCVRCYRIEKPGGAKLAGDCVGYGLRPHYILSCGTGIYCGICGVYSFAQTKMLSTACLGRPANQGSAGRLRKLLAGEHPTKCAWLGAEVCPAIEDIFHVLL